MEAVVSLDPDSCYRAVTSRDGRFDGMFFTAVNTTGIYCRPVCAARTPRRSSCTFYGTAAAAERDGYRPCLRCRPELAPGRPDLNVSLAEAVYKRIEGGALDEGSVDALARVIGVSSRHLRRIVVEHFGVSPVEVAQTHRLLFAKKLLQETVLPMTGIALSAGFGSVRRFNAAFRDHYRVSPSALRRDAKPTGGTVQDGEITLRLAYRAPLAWQELLGYLARRATPGVEEVGENAYWRSVAIGAAAGETASGWLRVRARAGNGTLEVTLPETVAGALMPLTHRLRNYFDLDSNPAAIGAHLRGDKALAVLIDRWPGLRMPGAWDPFELALKAVLNQQVSLAGARTLAARLVEQYGARASAPVAQISRAYPSAARLAEVKETDIARLGMPRARARAVREIARFASEGGLELRPGASLDEIVGMLTALPGIGPWTANYIAMRVARHPDAFPAGDLGLRKAVAQIDGLAQLPTEAAMRARAERWRPWRAYAAAWLWQSLTSKDEK